MLKRTDIHLIQLEIVSLVLLLIYDHDQSVTVTLLILSYLALLAICTALSVKYLRGHSYAYPVCLVLELPLMACSVQFLYPCMHSYSSPSGSIGYTGLFLGALHTCSLLQQCLSVSPGTQLQGAEHT